MTRLGFAAAAIVASSLLIFHPLAYAQTSPKFVLQVGTQGTGFGQIDFPGWGKCPVNSILLCAQYFNANSIVVLTAEPETDSVLAGWSGACTGIGPCQVTMDANKMVTATINARPGTNYLSVSHSPRGTVVSTPAGINCGQSSVQCRANFPAQTIATLTATPASGYTFAGWMGSCGGAGLCQLAMTQQRSVTADFEEPNSGSSNYTALWWNPAESGWGVNVNHQGDILFATLFTYDASGTPMWLVMSAGHKTTYGTYYAGDLYRTTGPAFNAVPFTPITEANLTKVGSMAFNFNGPDTATMTYTANGVSMLKSIRRQIYGSRLPNCSSTTGSRAASINYQDLWWNPSESGWGINITHQDDILFATLFTYDATGRDLWLVMSAGRKQADGSYFGDLNRTRGPAFNASPFTPIGAGDMTTVGTMRLSFIDGNNGTLAYTYNGAPVTKSITRQVFSSPLPLCN